MEIPEPPSGWNARLREQLTFHWKTHVRPKLTGLTDDEYFWEPVPDCWSVRPREDARTEIVGGSGAYVAEFAYPEPDPAPVTTIAWRLGHITVGVFGMRNASHFGGPPIDYFSYDYPSTAAQALADLDDGCARWVDGVEALGIDGLERQVGEAEGPFAAHTMADLALHIHREVIHHGAEILLLRDLYRSRATELS
jgi:hypothetical protein